MSARDTGFGALLDAFGGTYATGGGDEVTGVAFAGACVMAGAGAAAAGNVNDSRGIVLRGVTLAAGAGEAVTDLTVDVVGLAAALALAGEVFVAAAFAGLAAVFAAGFAIFRAGAFAIATERGVVAALRAGVLVLVFFMML